MTTKIPKLATKSYVYHIWQRDDGLVGMNTIVSISRGSGSFTVVGSPTPPTHTHSFRRLHDTEDFTKAKQLLEEEKSKSNWKPTMKAVGLHPVHGQSGPPRAN